MDPEKTLTVCQVGSVPLEGRFLSQMSQGRVELRGTTNPRRVQVAQRRLCLEGFKIRGILYWSVPKLVKIQMHVSK